ncbi:hypothetical protein [Shinella granuli]|uniref:Uncharacterized protein n=1 Tax=Shinella granuli TaxID=323621 RepID=A0A4R2D0C8_SHIGR|nr:hypothetical protein [Shinella granuli]TCN46865.1 hypothetical protein EV665_10333 [Shinella granuli]
MAKPIHPADAADRAKIANATHFNVHLRKGPTEKINQEAPTLAEAVKIADAINAESRKPAMIYAVMPEGTTVFVPKDMADAARQGEPPAEPVPKPERKPAGKRAAILEAAQRGELPAAPDFSAATHKPHRKKLEAVVAMVRAGDIEGLKAFEIKPVSTSPRAIARYRDLAVIALAALSRSA